MSGLGRPNRFRVGAMRHRCTIQTAVTTVDGHGQPVVSWVNYVVDEPCEYNPTSGIETMRGRQLEAGTRAVFVVRYRSGYNTQMSLVFEGERFGITAINRVDGLKKYLEIVCAEVL